jgi:methanethiol S-methyltransferase
MNRILAVGYGAVCYLAFLAAFLYAIGFVGNIVVPRSIDAGISAPIAEAVGVNVLLLGLFAVQHSVMARPAFKRWWTRLVPNTVERSTYVLLASLTLFVLFWQWRTMPAVMWDVTWPAGRVALQVLFWVGYAAGAIIGGITADLWGLRAAIWAAAAITVVSGLAVAARMYETHPRPNQCHPAPR